jgi:hypothetical protein
MGAKMGRFDKVACLRFDERTEKADLRLWEYNPSSSVGRLVSRRGDAPWLRASEATRVRVLRQLSSWPSMQRRAHAR